MNLQPKSQGYDFIERVHDDVVPAVGHQLDYVEEIVKKSDDIDQIQHQFEDNRFMDHMSDHLVTTTAGIHVHEQQSHVEHFDDDEPELPNKIDFIR